MILTKNTMAEKIVKKVHGIVVRELFWVGKTDRARV